MELKEGLSHTSEVVVSDSNSAKHWGSGALDVFATPAMVALMENAAMNAVKAYLPEGSDTVGTAVNINHVKATGLGDTVRATAILKEIDGRKLVFEVMASDSKGEIGNGTHTRFIVDREKFLSRL
jgi:Predicted thioesterase